MPGSSRSAVRPADPAVSHLSAQASTAKPALSQDGLQNGRGYDAALVASEEGIGSEPASLLINEIGLGLSPLPTSSPAQAPEDALEADAGCDLALGAEPIAEPELVNVIQFLNPAEGAVVTEALTIEFLNADRSLVVLSIPDGLTVPGGGGLTVCQKMGPDTDATVAVQVLSAAGFILHDLVVAEAAFWGLGSDTNEPLAVNLVYRAGGEDQASLDTFVANLRRAEIATLSSAPDFGVASRTRLISSENFETYFADLSTTANIFSRVFEEDSLPKAEVAPLFDVTAGSVMAGEPTEGAKNAGDLVVGDKTGVAVPLGASKAKGVDGHNGQRHGVALERHFGHKSQQLLKSGPGGLRSDI